MLRFVETRLGMTAKLIRGHRPTHAPLRVSPNSLARSRLEGNVTLDLAKGLDRAFQALDFEPVGEGADPSKCSRPAQSSCICYELLWLRFTGGRRDRFSEDRWAADQFGTRGRVEKRALEIGHVGPAEWHRPHVDR